LLPGDWILKAEVFAVEKSMANTFFVFMQILNVAKKYNEN
jgi:hypothetical protein